MFELQKICSRCRLQKSFEDFNFRNRSRNLKHSYCKECGKTYTQNHYRNSKKLYLQRNLKSYAQRRKIVLDAKQKPCADCGIEYPYYVMDFDHREGETKLFSLFKIHNATKKMILSEIEKCDLVCANCHRERTHQRRINTK
jgi:hypothetical protein